MSNKVGKKIDGLIRGIASRTVGYRAAVQAAAVLIVEHAKETDDCSRALKLCEAVGMASDRVKLIQWFGLVSPINITYTADVSKRRVSLRKDTTSKAYNPFDVTKAKATLYHTVGKSDDEITEELTSAETNSLLLKLAKKLAKRLEAGEVAANDVDKVTAKIAGLRQLAAIAA